MVCDLLRTLCDILGATVPSGLKGSHLGQLQQRELRNRPRCWYLTVGQQYSHYFKERAFDLDIEFENVDQEMLHL